MALSGREAALRITGATATSSTDVAATRSTGTAGTGYVQITSTAQRFLDPSTTHSLYRVAAGSTTLVASSDYTINHVQGKFQWKAGDPSTGTYNADIRYLTATSVAGGREWTLNVDQDMFEITEFGSSGWKQYQPNLVGATASINRFWNDSTFFDYLNTDQRFVVDLVINSAAANRYQAFGYVESDQINTPVDGLVGETVNVRIDGAVYYTTN